MNIGKYIQIYSEDLKLKNYADNTIKNYVAQTELFLKHFNNTATKPSEISEKQIKEWLMLAKSINSRKHRISAIKLFYQLTIRQPLKFKHIPYPRSEKKLPIVLSQDEIQRMFDVCENLKHRVLLALLYSCGLRISEMINLKWENIDRSRMIIHVINAKGNKDRQVGLPQHIVPLLEKYYFRYKPNPYVLAGQFNTQYTRSSANQVLKQLAHKAKINKRMYAHLIRHCTFTHMVESGTDINLVQRIAGHNNVKTTMMYCHISDALISKINSPINNINI